MVNHSAKKLFALVNDTPAYVNFVPYCHRAAVISDSENERVGELEFRAMGFSRVLTTKNTLYHSHRIDVDLVSGPFTHLHGSWLFHEMSDGVTEVEIDFEFDVELGVFGALFAPLFKSVLDQLVSDFSNYADRIYGHESH